jgi:hypothetical protein
MRKNSYVFLAILLIGSSFLISACAAPAKRKEVSLLPRLEVSFADATWNGKAIPKGQQCKRFGGKNPQTPRLIVKNIPPGTNAIIMEYSDESYAPMDKGGHGKIGYRVPEGTIEKTIPSVPGHTFDLPQGFFLVAAHANPAWDKAGAYMPPCSGGRGNYYYVTVKAVNYASPDDKQPKLLGIGELSLGRY